MNRALLPKKALADFAEFCEEHGWKRMKLMDSSQALRMQRLGDTRLIVIRGTNPETTYHTTSGIGAEFVQHFANQMYKEQENENSNS